MEIPNLIYLTAVAKLEGLDKLVAVRPDVVVFVERTRLDQAPPKPPLKQVGIPTPGPEATMVVLSTGIQITVAEPVQEVMERVNNALERARPRRWWRR